MRSASSLPHWPACTAAGERMHSIMVWPDRATLLARSERALASVDMTEGALEGRVSDGTTTPEELDAWLEVDTVRFLLHGR